jgi:hypothetical protein
VASDECFHGQVVQQLHLLCQLRDHPAGSTPQLRVMYAPYRRGEDAGAVYCRLLLSPREMWW